MRKWDKVYINQWRRVDIWLGVQFVIFDQNALLILFVNKTQQTPFNLVRSFGLEILFLSYSKALILVSIF